MKCPNCNHEFNAPVPDNQLWELSYMIGKGHLFHGLLSGDKWKTDLELVDWLSKGWVELDKTKGFLITTDGIKACTKARQTVNR